MEITEEQLRLSLAHPDNLANCFRNGKVYDYVKERLSAEKTENKEGGPENKKSESIESLPADSESVSERSDGITHKIIKRPGNCRPWLSKQERTGIALAATNRFSGETKSDRIRLKEIAEENGVLVSTVSDIANNKRRVEDSPRSADKEKVAEAQKDIDAELDKVREAAIEKLMAGLGHLTSDKISGHNAKDISSICANMSKVVKDTIPDKVQPQSINLIVYTPELRNEKTYEVIEI